MDADDLRWELDRLGLTQNGLARLLDIEPRTVRRWATGQYLVPRSVDLLLERLGPEEAQELAKGEQTNAE
jgi:DNA-binding transcriptional regulator YiaG